LISSFRPLRYKVLIVWSLISWLLNSIQLKFYGFVNTSSWCQNNILNGYLDKTICMTISESLPSPTHANLLCKLTKSLYGLKQSSHTRIHHITIWCKYLCQKIIYYWVHHIDNVWWWLYYNICPYYLKAWLGDAKYWPKWQFSILSLTKYSTPQWYKNIWKLNDKIIMVMSIPF
jgi:hypothetical protein